MKNFTKKKKQRLTGVLLVALTMVYLLVSVAIAQKSSFTAEKSKITYHPDHLSWGDVWQFGLTEYEASYYKDQNSTAEYKYYNHSEGNSDKNKITAPVSQSRYKYYGELKIENRQGITDGTALVTHGAGKFYANIDNVQSSVPAPIGIDGVTIPTVTTNSTGVYSVVPDKAGFYRIYVYSPNGAPTGVRYALLESYQSNNSYDAQMQEARTFTPVGNTGWYYATLTVSNLSWSAYAPSVATSTPTSNSTDGGVKTYDPATHTMLGTTTYYPYNNWTVTERFYNTVLAIQFDSSVQLGPITWTGDSLTVNTTSEGVVTMLNPFGEEVPFGAYYHMPVFFRATPTGEAEFTGFVDADGNKVNGITTYTRGEGEEKETLFGYVFETTTALTAGWEKKFAFPTMQISGAATATLDYYINTAGEHTFDLGTATDYVFTADYYTGSVDSDVVCTIERVNQGTSTKETKTLSKDGEHSFTVSAQWEAVNITFTSEYEGTTKQMTYRIIRGGYGESLGNGNVFLSTSATTKTGYSSFKYIEDALMAAQSGQYVIIPGDVSFQGADEPRNPLWGDMNGGPGYTVKAGVTLLTELAVDDGVYAGTGGEHPYAFEEKVDNVAITSGAMPGDGKSTGTLTIPEGVNLNIAKGGVMAVFGTTNGVEMITQYYTEVCVEEDASITVNGVLSSCGFIHGDGMVYGKNGGQIYVPFTVTDFRGGGYTVGAAGKLGSSYGVNPLVSGEKAITPFERYSFNAIQCDQFIECGGNVFAYADLYADSDHRNSTAQVIGTSATSALLALTDSTSYLEITYDSDVYVKEHPSIGKMTLKVHGNASYGGMTLTVDPGDLMSSVDIDTSKITFVLPYAFDLEIVSGTFAIPNSVSVLPGATVKVCEGATLEVSSQLTIYDGLNERTAVSTADEIVLTEYADEYPNATKLTPNKCYPSSSALQAAPFSGSGSANLVVDGTLHVKSGASLGGIIQTSGGSNAVINFESGAGTSTTTQIGATGHYSVFGMYEYSLVGATVRTLKAQVMDMATGERVDLVPGEEYTAVAGQSTIDSYAYNLYYYCNGSTLKSKSIPAEPSGASTQGFWYNYAVPTYVVMDGQVSSEAITIYLAKGADLTDLGYYTDAACTAAAEKIEGPVDALYYKGTVEAKVVWAADDSETFYPTVRQAVSEAVNAGDRVVVLVDLNGFADAISPLADQDFIFDLNGNTMTYASTPFVLSRGGGKMAIELNGGTVTNVDGETVLTEARPLQVSAEHAVSLDLGGGQIVYQANAKSGADAVISNAGEMTLNLGGGTILYQLPAEVTAASAVIENLGTMTINMGATGEDGTVIPGTIEYRTGAAAAATRFNTKAAILNQGELTVNGAVGTEVGAGGLIKVDMATSSTSLVNYVSAIRNMTDAKLVLDGVTVESAQDINANAATILNYSGAEITRMTKAAVKNVRGYGIWNYGSTIKTIEDSSFNTSNGIMNRNILGNSYTTPGGATISKYATIELIKDTDMEVGQYGIDNGGVIGEIRGGTYTAHPDTKYANTLGAADVYTQKENSVYCYTIYNSNLWWYNTAVWRQTNDTVNFIRVNEQKEGEEYRPTIGKLIDVTINAENTSTSATYGYALYNAGVIGEIGGETTIKTYVYEGHTGTLTTSSYALMNTAGGIIKKMTGNVDISATGSYALYNASQFTLRTQTTYGNKIGGVVLHTLTDYGNPSEIGEISCSGTIDATASYGLYSTGSIGSITSVGDGLTISSKVYALYNALGAYDTYDYTRTYTNNADSATETKREEVYEYNMERGSRIGTITGVSLVATGTDGYYALLNQGYIETLDGVSITSVDHRNSADYPLVTNGNDRRTGYTLVRTTTPTADNTLYITQYDYDYRYDAENYPATINLMKNCTITGTYLDTTTDPATSVGSNYVIRNSGKIGTISGSTISGGSYVLDNTTTGPYTERTTVRYYSGATIFATTKNVSEISIHYERALSEIGMIDGCTISSTKANYPVSNAGKIGTIQNSSITSKSTNAIYNSGNPVVGYDYNFWDILGDVTATTSGLTLTYGLNNETKVVTTEYGVPEITLIGSGNTITATDQAILNAGIITAIDGGTNPSSVKATANKGEGIYNYRGNTAIYVATTPYTAGTAGTTVKEYVYNSANIGLIANTKVEAKGHAVRNGDDNTTYTPVIDELGEGLEAKANYSTYNAVYNSAKNAEITKISGGIYTATKASAYAVYNASETYPIHLTGGDFKGDASNKKRDYAIYDADNSARYTYKANYELTPQGTYRQVTFTDKSTGSYYYYLRKIPRVETVTGETPSSAGTHTSYSTLAEAIEAYTAMSSTDKAKTYITLVADTTETGDIELSEDLYLDLAGFDVDMGNYTLDTGDCTLYGIDSGTNRFLTGDKDSAGSIIGTVDGIVSPIYTVDRGAQEGKSYLAVTVDDVIQFHRVAASITAVQFYLDNPDAYLSMEGQFRGTKAGMDALTNLGFRIIDSDDVVDDQMFDDEDNDLNDGRAIGLIKPAGYENGALTDCIHYTCVVDLNTDIQAKMVFGEDAGKNEVVALGYLHQDILKTVLDLAKENFDPQSNKYTAIANYIAAQSEEGAEG